MAEDVIARYLLDLSTLKGQVQELERTFNKAEGAASTSAKKVSTSFNQAATSAKSSLQGIGESIIAAFAVREVINFAKEAVNAFAKAESQVNQLKFAITKIGGESDAAFGKLITQAKELASITFFDDEDIAQAQALQAQFGLNSDQIQKLTPLILELSVATGQDLPAATQTALQAITGQTRGLKVVGAAFKDTGSLTENFNILTENLSKLQGTAAQALDTTAGAIKRNAVEIENANEKIGEKLAPALVKLNSLFLDLKGALASFVVDFADFVGGSDAPKKFDDIAKAAKASNDVLVESFKKQFEGLDPKSISDKLDFVTEKFNDYKNDLKNIDDQIAANNLKAANLPIDTNRKANLEAIKKENDELRIQRSVVADAQKQYSSQVIALIQLSRQGGTVTKQQATDIESLTKLSIEQLKALQDQLENNGNNGIANQDALKNIDDVIKAKLEAEKKFGSDQIKLRSDALQKLKDLDEKANQQSLEGLAESEAKKLEIQRDAQLKLINDTARQAGGGKDVEAIRLSAVVATNKFYNKQIVDANQKAADDLFKILQEEVDKENNLKEKNQAIDLSRIDRDTQREIIALKTKYNELGDFSEDAEKKLQDRILNAEIDGINKKLLAVQKGSDKELELKNELQDKLSELGKQDPPKIAFFDREDIQRSIDLAQQLVGTLNELYQQAANEQIAQIERVKEAEIKALDDQLSANQRNLDDRKIGAREFRQTEDRLIKQKQAAEETARKKEIEIKRKQDIANRAQKLFEITIATARAIAEVSPNPDLIALAAVLGAAQTAVVLGTPLPQYAKGTKYVDKESRFAPGIDTVPAMLTRGERVITAKDNKEHWELYEAVSNKRLNDYVLKKYVTPALLKAQSTAKITDQRTFAENVAYSLSLNEKSLASEIASAINKDNEWRTRRGQKVIGMDDLIETIKSTSKPQYRRN